MKDKLEGLTLNGLKCKYVIEEAFREAKRDVKIIFGNPTNAEIKRIKKVHKWRNHEWTSVQETLCITIPDTWYEDIYLNGIGTVRYNNALSIALTAVEEDISKLNPKLALPGMKLYKVKMPIFSTDFIQSGPTKYHGHWIHDCKPQERFMVSTEVTDKTLCFAGLSPNRAASSLKKNMMKVMQEEMGL